MDHIQGLGFFAPLYEPGLEVHIWGPPSATLDLRARLSRYLSPPLFPVCLRDLPCDLTLHNVVADRHFSIRDLEVQAALVCHPGPTVGYRITRDGRSVVYLPDHEPALCATNFPHEVEWTSGTDLAANADLLIHDAQYTSEEYATRVGWGHSTIEHAFAFARLTRVKRLVPFHHDPDHSDEDLDRLFREAAAAEPLSFQVQPGREGATFDLR
jgi:ribonuclease BN (tRNA processing enzyme)